MRVENIVDIEFSELKPLGRVEKCVKNPKSYKHNYIKVAKCSYKPIFKQT